MSLTFRYRFGWDFRTHKGMLDAIAPALENQQVPVVHKPVDHGRRHLVISKYAAPLREFQIRCQDQALAFIAVGYYAE
jgi:hypothetical protein